MNEVLHIHMINLRPDFVSSHTIQVTVFDDNENEIEQYEDYVTYGNYEHIRNRYPDKRIMFYERNVDSIMIWNSDNIMWLTDTYNPNLLKIDFDEYTKMTEEYRSEVYND